DVVKALYVGQNSNRATALASVLADRLIGLLGLCVFALLAAALQTQIILQDEQLTRVMLLLVALAAACLLGCLTLAVVHQTASAWARRLSTSSRMSSALRPAMAHGWASRCQFC